MKKVYVEVTARFGIDGEITPVSFRWEDGKRYAIDEIYNARRVASLKAGGIGMRYDVRVNTRRTFLWYEEPAWFMEGRE